MSKPYARREPERDALERLLRREHGTLAGTILRLAWLEGLSRDDIVSLTWKQVNYDASELRLAKRTVPLCAEMADCLREWQCVCQGEYVCTGKKGPMHPSSISRIARIALDSEGQTETRLPDLRFAFILREIELHGWAYALRVSGLSVTTYRNFFAGRVQSGQTPPPESGQDSDYLLWRILQDAQHSPAGLALWLSCRLGLHSEEIVSLTWEQVDFSRAVIRLAEREAAMTNAVSRILKEELERRSAEDDPHVLLSSRTRRPMTAQRLSALTRTLLVRGGLEQHSLRSLRRDTAAEEEKKKLLAYVSAHGSIRLADCAALLQTAPARAHTRLRALTAAGELTRIGTVYYAAHGTVAPERHSETVRAYLAAEGSAYRQDIARLLNVSPGAASRVLKDMAERGEVTLLHREKRYTLPENMRR